MKTDILIQTNWIKNSLPGIDGIVFSSGKVIIMDFYEVINSYNDTKKYFINPLCETTLESILYFNDDIWCEIQKNPKEQIYNDRIFICGEGSMGNEGFIANTNKNNTLLWAFFSTSSNPFYKIELENDILKAYSTHDLIYYININKPEKITVSKE